MTAFTLDMFQTTGLAMLLFVLGRFLITRVEFLRRCCIPAPVVGGLIFAIVHLALYQGQILQLSFDESVKNFFMTLFFTSVGYTACFRLLKRGGKKVFLFVEDNESGIDYDGIYAMDSLGGISYPLSYDSTDGCIVFECPASAINVYIPDLVGNELILILTPNN